MRWVGLGSQSLDGDELFTAWIVQMDLFDLARAVGRTESTPYLFYVLDSGTTAVLGNGEFGLRALSALAGTALVPGIYFAAREFVSDRAALVAAALASVNPFLVWCSQQARAYSLLFAIGVLSLGFCGRYLRANSRRALWGWSASGAVAIWVHYFGAFLIGAEAIWILIAARRRGEAAPAARAFAPPLVAGAALLPLAIHQVDRGSPSDIGATSLGTRLLQIPKNFLVGFSGPAEIVFAALAALLILVALLGLRRTSSPERDGALVAGGIAAVAVGVPIALALVGVDYVTSVALGAALGAAMVCLSAGFAASRGGLVAAAGLCAVSLALVIAVAADDRYQRQDWRGALAAAGRPGEPGALVMGPAVPPGVLSYYSGPVRDAGRIERVCEVTVVALAKGERFSLGTPAPPDLDPRELGVPADFAPVEGRRTDTYTLLRFRSEEPKPFPGPTVAGRFPEELGRAYIQVPPSEQGRSASCSKPSPS